MLTLSHSPAEGTLLHGTTRGDAAGKALKAIPRYVAYWRWSGTLDAWFIVKSRDRRVRKDQIEATATALRAAGFEVTVELGDERRSVADQEAERAERAGARVDRLTARAGTLKASGEAGWNAAREYASHIPLGQPILVGHHSEARHRATLAKIDRMEDRAIDQIRAGKDAEQRAAAARANQAHREHGATTVRRIEKLEAELRKAQRGMTERKPWTTDEQFASAVEHWTPIAEELEEKLTYWREYLRGLTEAGVYRVWSRADFTKGDFVASRYGWSEVQRVNAKTLTIPHILDELGAFGHTWPLPYDMVTGRRSAEEHAAAVAARAARAARAASE